MEQYTNSVTADLRYRNQFILGPEFPPGFDDWKKIKTKNFMYLTVHPELEVVQASHKNISITCLGFLLDPDNPKATDLDIVKNLAENCHNFKLLIEQTARFGGRWILLYEDGKNISLVNDATGLRQVFYTAGLGKENIWCASQPRIIADLLKLQVDGDASDFISYLLSCASQGTGEPMQRWWPGTGSPYKEIKHLIPNHYLDINTGCSYRFWPSKEFDNIPLKVAVEEASATLQGMMLSASNHFDELTLLITGGMDSRLLLAASRTLADKISYITVDSTYVPSADISIPASVLSGVGLKHNVAVSNSRPSTEFREVYEQHSMLAHDPTMAYAEALLPYLARKRVAVTGHDAGVFRNFYRLPKFASSIRKLTPEMITRLARQMENHPFAIHSFGEWLEGLNDTYNYNVLDLLYWEQRSSNWLADWLLGYDLVWKDCVLPLNSRHLLNAMLSVDEKYRKKKGSTTILHTELILKLWPAVLRPDLAAEKAPLIKRLKRKARETYVSVLKNAQLLLVH